MAINDISCREGYKTRFEEFFGCKAKVIDLTAGFKFMEVLKPFDENGDYLIVSHWESELRFKEWTWSPVFLERQKRGFEDLAQANREGKDPPMTSTFRTNKTIAG